MFEWFAGRDTVERQETQPVLGLQENAAHKKRNNPQGAMINAK